MGPTSLPPRLAVCSFCNRVERLEKVGGGAQEDPNLGTDKYLGRQGMCSRLVLDVV